jgi:hypothetical protein
MSQKSSLLQPAKSVSWVLTLDNFDIFGVPLTPHGLHSFPVFGFLLRGQLAAGVSAPSLRKPAAPITKGSGGNSVNVENAPSGVVTTRSVARKSMQLAVWDHNFRRRDPGGADCRAELLDEIDYARLPSMA